MRVTGHHAHHARGEVVVFIVVHIDKLAALAGLEDDAWGIPPTKHRLGVARLIIRVHVRESKCLLHGFLLGLVVCGGAAALPPAPGGSLFYNQEFSPPKGRMIEASAAQLSRKCRRNERRRSLLGFVSIPGPPSSMIRPSSMNTMLRQTSRAKCT